MQTISFSIAKIRVNLLYHLYLDYEYLEYIYQYLLYLPIVQSILVGGFNSPEKYESQIGSSSQLLVKIKFMFQTTNQYLQIGSVCFRIHQITRFTRLQQ